MSLYNMLFGKNPFHKILLQALDISEGDVPRFRDCYLTEDGSKIAVYTRTGGGNRPDYETENSWMQNVFGFISDCDDDFDCTYATFFYEIPEAFKPMIETLQNMGAEDNPQEKFQQLIADMDAKKETPETKRALEVGRSIFEQMENLPSGGVIEL